MFPAYSKNQNLCKALKDEPFGSLLGWYSPKEKVCGSLHMKGTTDSMFLKIEFIKLIY